VKKTVQSCLCSAWIAAAVLLGVFLLTTSYKYGWDDQHLEIVLLKHLIDPSLYANDYYVKGLKAHFSSFFYPLLARMITVEQIPAVYWGLYLLARYFLFFWIYKFWLAVSRRPYQAFVCGLTLILVTRVNEFLYRTFSHQEFALPWVMAGLYYFIRGRFALAALILGITANIHALYSLFPFLFMTVYLAVRIRKDGLWPLVRTVLIFTACASPFIVWTLKNRFLHAPVDRGADWLSLYIKACPQNFFFPQDPRVAWTELLRHPVRLWAMTQSYLWLAVLFGVNALCFKRFARNKRLLSICLTAFGLLGVCFVFTYLWPVALVIDLNLTRMTQFLSFVLTGCATLLVLETARRYALWRAMAGVAALSMFKLGALPGMLGAVGIGWAACWRPNALIKADASWKERGKALFGLGIGVGLGWAAAWVFRHQAYGPGVYQVTRRVALGLAAAGGLYTVCGRFRPVLRQGLILIPLAVFLTQFYHYRAQRVRMEEQGGGFWALQRAWEDMQRYTRVRTPKDAVILVPYNMEMGGFRIFSERSVVVSYRDCGIIGFDYPAAREWDRRVRDVKDFKVVVRRFPKEALVNAVERYGADYIVFMRYASPPKNTPFLQYIYGNKYFTLFKVMQYNTRLSR